MSLVSFCIKGFSPLLGVLQLVSPHCEAAIQKGSFEQQTIGAVREGSSFERAEAFGHRVWTVWEKPESSLLLSSVSTPGAG